ncbi:uncharacterized protein LOC129001221 [Macrosteles quadrilineatus]|uniref:uncharacterized protein LOC129001221 n=1 Tax=Macrosteles quadrilineatus TaxID=74068 RepID=UPI0023E1FA7A|nr:uncharacterized protein LOC129001221 [Macrosteles quadrilineatus]
MVQCCEDFPGGQTDCTNIHLIPETRIVEPNVDQNFTLIHPTLYPYNRRGECLLGVHYMSSCNRSKEALQHIAFDTALSEQNVKCSMVRGFPGYIVERPPCNSYDEDALNNCKMVDCHMKYFGLRSFFNKASRVCEPVPACLPSKRRGMPDVVYDVASNQCTDMNSCLDEEDLQHLAHADLEPDCFPYSNSRMAYLDCHRGALSNVSGECECEPEFQSAEMPDEPGNPRTQIFHSCNIDTSCWALSRLLSPPDTQMMVIAFILALVVAIMSLVIVHPY